MHRPSFCHPVPRSLCPPPIRTVLACWHRGGRTCTDGDNTKSNSSTILSIDGVGAYDTISRNSMLSGLFHTPEANRCLPFVRLWYTTASEYVWHDATAPSTPIHKQRGVNKGTPSCRPCSLWAKSQPDKPSKHSSNPAKSSTFFWTTFMQWCSQSASGPSTTC